MLATCRPKPGLTPGDGLLATALRAPGRDRGRPAPGTRSSRGGRKASSAFDRRGTITCDGRVQGLGAAGSRTPGRLWNPPPTVLWNADKLYLRDLAAAGIAVPRTQWFQPGERPEIARLLEEWGVTLAVLKPRVSATAFGTHVVSRDRGNRARRIGRRWSGRDVCSSCSCPGFRAGERSRSSSCEAGSAHAVLKRPATAISGCRPTSAEASRPRRRRTATIAFGEAVLAAAARPWIYARVDLVETDEGPVLMELELIEPDLFLTPRARRGSRKG